MRMTSTNMTRLRGEDIDCFEGRDATRIHKKCEEIRYGSNVI